MAKATKPAPAATKKVPFVRPARAPTVVQAVAWEIKGGVKGSLTRLSDVSGITLDALRIAKRSPGTSGARPLSPSRVRQLALILAVHRNKDVATILKEAAKIEAGWRELYPDGIAD